MRPKILAKLLGKKPKGNLGHALSPYGAGYYKVWAGIGVILLVMLVVGGVLWWRLGIMRSHLPGWRPGMWWRYKASCGELLTIMPRMEEQIFRADGLELLVLDEVMVDEHAFYLVVERYFTDGGVVVRTRFVDRNTLSDYPMADIVEAGIDKRKFEFPLEVGKRWEVRPGWIAQVEERKILDLPGGAVMAYRIDYQQGSRVWSVWYAPRVQNIVQIKGKGICLVVTEYGQKGVQEVKELVYADLEAMRQALPLSTFWELEMLSRYDADSRVQE